MRLSRLLLPAAAVCLMSAGAFADPPPPPPHGDHGPGAPGGPMNFLTPEEHIMLFADIQAATKGMNDDQRHTYMRNRFESFKTMSDGAKKAFAADLKTRWDALPPALKDELKKQAAEMRKKGPPPGDPGDHRRPDGPGPQQ
jgi:hypothetical protein